MTAVEFPNAELAVRGWLRNWSPLVAALTADGSTSDQIDLVPHASKSCVVVYRAGGGPDPYYPVDFVVLGLDVEGKAPVSLPAPRQAAMNIQSALTAALWQMGGVVLVDGVRSTDAQVESQLWLPYSDGRARYSNTAVIGIAKTALAA